MNNWTQRLAIFAVLGAILSSAMLVGCGGSGEEEAAAGNKAATSGVGKEGSSSVSRDGAE